MKHATRNHAASHYVSQPMYPNAADTNYFTQKSMEILTAVASGLGCIVGMVFLVIMA